MSIFDLSSAEPNALSDVVPGTSSISENTERIFWKLTTEKHIDDGHGKVTAGDLLTALSPVSPSCVSLQVVIINKLDYAIRHSPACYRDVPHQGFLAAYPMTSVYKMDGDDFVGDITYKDGGIIPGRTVHAGKTRYGIGRYLFMPNRKVWLADAQIIADYNQAHLHNLLTEKDDPDWKLPKYTNLYGALSFQNVEKNQPEVDIAVAWNFFPFKDELYIDSPTHIPQMEVTTNLKKGYGSLSDFANQKVNANDKQPGSRNKVVTKGGWTTDVEGRAINVSASMAGRYSSGKIQPFSKTILMFVYPD